MAWSDKIGMPVQKRIGLTDQWADYGVVDRIADDGLCYIKVGDIVATTQWLNDSNQFKNTFFRFTPGAVPNSANMPTILKKINTMTRHYTGDFTPSIEPLVQLAALCDYIDSLQLTILNFSEIANKVPKQEPSNGDS